MPTASITTKPRISPSTELSRPLAPLAATPAASSTLAAVCRALRVRAALHAAPANTTTAPAPEPTAAKTRGPAPNTSEPRANSSAGSGAVNGLAMTTPTPTATASATATPAMSPARRPKWKYTVPTASAGTVATAPAA